jgi:hypothetical protein
VCYVFIWFFANYELQLDSQMNFKYNIVSMLYVGLFRQLLQKLQLDYQASFKFNIVYVLCVHLFH